MIIEVNTVKAAFFRVGFIKSRQVKGMSRRDVQGSGVRKLSD
jgi:hypothetical protein